MCEATVYMERGGQCEKVMEDVVYIESAGAEIMLGRLFEAARTIEGVIREVDFLKHRVVLTMQRAER